MTHENLIATIDAVRNSNPDRWKRTPYQNRQNLWGWHFAFWYARSYHFISIHNCPAPQSPEPIAYAIEGIKVISDERWGVYGNGKGVLGFYATARSTRAIGGSLDHWFMIGRSAEEDIRTLLLRKRYLEPEETDLLQYLYPENRLQVDWPQRPFPGVWPSTQEYGMKTDAKRTGLQF